MEERDLKFVKDRRFEELRKGILNEITDAHIHLDIISEFLNAPSTFRLIMKKYDGFFYATQWAHMKLLCINICNITKHDDQTSNIPRLLCYIRFHKALSKILLAEEMTTIEDKLKAHTDFLDILNILRDQYYAHNQLNAKKIEATWGDIVNKCKPLLLDLESIYGLISLRYDRTKYLISMTPNANVLGLLTDLTEYKRIKKINKKNGNSA